MKLNDSNDKALKPLVDMDGDPIFDEAWQAQALAMADSLVKSGLFSANDWSNALGQSLKESANRADIDSQLTYYQSVLKTLEQLIADHSEIDAALMDSKRQDWEKAYLNTPHGQPVTLDEKPC
jgi:nitrile hydratase accessory protein|tara:strand:- start:507 stop:875 length:369 start_codon:yes stop_codon:yes gene_type:complete